ncbi:MAG: FKBP-type peptidyl-prolyl cis-trans isomerase [Flavobacteriales bacterium]|jgi:FKBP-type peptidyl-prolyl cis-trans isomerase|nr:FKBP-type peptidyl-prolyl cis-trans isomerase [Flavobacteriales bacterium]
MIRYLHFPLLSFMIACGGGAGERNPVPAGGHDQAERLIGENRDAVRMEDRDIRLYAARMELDLRTTDRGVRYRIVRDEPGPTVRGGQWAMVNYRSVLLNGDTAYASTPGRPEAFKVEMDDVESGLHEGVQLLSPGDSAILVIPSYRAHGLIGDMDRIPPRSTVVYHIGLVKVSGEPFGEKGGAR